MQMPHTYAAHLAAADFGRISALSAESTGGKHFDSERFTAWLVERSNGRSDGGLGTTSVQLRRGKEWQFLSCGAAGNLDLPLPQHAGAGNGSADAAAGDRANPGPLWLPEDPGAAEPGRMESGQKTGVPPVLRGRLSPAAQAMAEAPRLTAATRTMPADRPNEVWSTGANITGDALRAIARAAVNRRYVLTSWVGVKLLVSV